MRYFKVFGLLLLLTSSAASAQQSTSLEYTAFDKRQFSKLRATVGTWDCTDVPASKKPDVVVTTQEGNFFVSRETGDTPETYYTRWSHGYKTYYAVTLYRDGGTTVATTPSMDPNNATWQISWPTKDTNGKPIPPQTVRTSGNTMVWTSTFYDGKGKIQHFKSTCVRR